MRAKATRLSREYPGVFDTCGTGGDRAHTFNVSTVAALVLAACGVPVAKHGNRSVSSRCGSADVFEALGVNVAANPSTVERCLDEAGIAFFFAPTFHPSMRHAAPTRRELGVRTAFNLLGPLTNPAAAKRQLVGVPRPELTELVARSLAMLGTERAWVVHGADGLDEISTTGYTKVSECRDGAVNTFYIHPADVGLPKAHPDALRGGDAGRNAEILRRLLNGEPGAARDIVLLNAAAALLIAGVEPRLESGLQRAASAIDSGRAAAVLDRLVALSTGSAEAAAS
jgi:anthranilate phosphoribosyltransferase